MTADELNFGGKETSRYLQRFQDVRVLTRVLCHQITFRLQRAIAERGYATLVVSGGRTPLALFEAMSKTHIPWFGVTITLADERWVPPDHPDSNEGLVRRHLVVNEAENAIVSGLYTGDPTPAEGLSACSDTLDALPRPFDAVVLGMGDDGHFASLFPGCDGLDEALSLESDARCAAMEPSHTEHARMTLTLPTLLQAESVILLITGMTKWQIYQRALNQETSAQLPVSALLHQTKRPVWVYWAP
jgi:6-phosphogluconolactonase